MFELAPLRMWGTRMQAPLDAELRWAWGSRGVVETREYSRKFEGKKKKREDKKS